MIEGKSYEAVKNSFVRFINRWGNPSMCISDSDPSFKALSRDYKLEDLLWIKGFGNSSAIKFLENTYDINFKFNTLNSPNLQGLVERLNKIILQSMLKLSHSNLRVSQFRTLLSANEAMLNKRTLGIMNELNPEIPREITPQHLVTGYGLRVSSKFFETTTVIPRSIQSKEDVIRHSRHLQYLISRSWVVFLKEYINDLNM